MGALDGEAERRAQAQLEDGVDLGRAAGCHRRNDLHHGAPGWLVRCGGRQCQRSRVELGLLEHYSKIPRALRQRTMVFVALDGHHNSAEGSAVGNQWIIQNRQKLFAKTALAINVEHPSTIQTQSRPRYYNANEIVWGNSYLPQQWYAGGPSRPELQQIVADAFKQFGATLALFASTGAITQVEHGGNLSDGAGPLERCPPERNTPTIAHLLGRRSISDATVIARPPLIRTVACADAEAFRRVTGREHEIKLPGSAQPVCSSRTKRRSPSPCPCRMLRSPHC